MRALTLTLAASAALVSACGGSSGEPRTAPPVSTSPASASSPTAEATGINAPTPQGASEFAKFFYAQIGKAFATRDPGLLTAVSLPTCKTCQLYIDSVSVVQDKQQRVDGGVFSVTFAVAPPFKSADAARVDVGWDFSGATFYDAAGRVVERHAAERGVEEQLRLVRQSDHWMVAEVTRTRTRG